MKESIRFYTICVQDDLQIMINVIVNSDASVENDDHQSDTEDANFNDLESADEMDVEETEIDQDLVTKTGKKRRQNFYVYGKGKKGSADRFKWTTKPPETHGGRSSNVSVGIIIPCCLENARTVKTPIEAWELLFLKT